MKKYSDDYFKKKYKILFDKLLQFLSFNKIKIDDKRIVYSGEEYSSLTDDLKSKLMIFKSKVSREIVDILLCG